MLTSNRVVLDFTVCKSVVYGGKSRVRQDNSCFHDGIRSSSFRKVLDGLSDALNIGLDNIDRETAG